MRLSRRQTGRVVYPGRGEVGNRGRRGHGNIKAYGLRCSVRAMRPMCSGLIADLVSLALTVAVSLCLTLTRFLIEPLYNSLPLTLHPETIYAAYTVLPALAYWQFTLRRSAQEAVSARVCLSIAAIGGDVVAVFGRRVGSLSGRAFGAEWGATVALSLLSLVMVGGSAMFALLCFVSSPRRLSSHAEIQDLVLPISPISKSTDKGKNLVQILLRSTGVAAHLWAGEYAWAWLLRSSTSALVQHPEKSVRRELSTC